MSLSSTAERLYYLNRILYPIKKNIYIYIIITVICVLLLTITSQGLYLKNQYKRIKHVMHTFFFMIIIYYS
jgi:hypothetical protein